MDAFVETEDFKSLNVGMALDEGLASPSEVFTVFYGERVPWWAVFKTSGRAGHGSRFIQGTAVEKLMKIVNQALEFRKEQEQKLGEGCRHGMAKKLGDVVTLNLTVLKSYTEGATGGFAFNVIPTEAQAGFDIRIPPSVDLEEFEALLLSWAEGQEGVTLEFANQANRLKKHFVTSTGKENGYWRTFAGSLEAQGLKFETEVFPAATDGRFLRKLGIPCFGFSPMNHTPILLHDHNEFLNREVYLRGIQIYERLITDLTKE